jgi:hypothetical protein
MADSTLLLRLAFQTDESKRVIVSIANPKSTISLAEVQALGNEFVNVDPFLGVDFTQFVAADMIERKKTAFAV